MPNNDLGTAHGRIRIDFEDRGSVKAAASLDKVQLQFEAMQDRVVELEKELKKSQNALLKTSTSMEKVERSSRGLKDSFWGTSRITKLLDKDIVDLTQDISELYVKVSQAREKFKPFETTFKVLDRYQRFKLDAPVDALGRSLTKLNFRNLGQAEHNVRSLNMALNSVGLGAAAAKAMAIQFSYGYRQAMSALPGWTRQAHQFAIALAGIGTMGLGAAKLLNTGFITKFLNTNMFRNMVIQSNSAGRALEKLGAVSQKVFGKNLFGNLEVQLKNSESILTRWTKNTSHTLNAGSRGFNSWFKPVDAAAKSIQKFTLGIGLMISGISDIASRFAFLGRIPKPLLVALAATISVVLPAALQIFNKALIGTSNILMGLGNGVKQLSGGLLALPGFFAAIGVVAGTLKTIFSGLADQFKDIFSDDPLLAAEAFAKLPEHLKPMATALKDVVRGFKEMRVELQKIAFKGLETQIKSLSEKYMPLLKTGMSSVTFALRGLKDEYVKFLEQTQTQKDTNKIFARTAEIVLNVKKAFGPVSDGLRDLAAVGTQFFAQWSAGLQSLAQRFADWVRLNRESGQLLNWMNEAKEGTRDLVNGTKDLGKALWGVLTMFRSKTGANFLDGYANSMARFNQIVKQSRQGGMLFDFSSAVRGLGDFSDKINTFKQVFMIFVDLLQSLAPAIQNMSDGFSLIFVGALETAMKSLRKFTEVMTGLGIDKFTGIILGMVAAFKILPTFLKPLWDGSRVLLGFIFTLRSANGVTKAVGEGVAKLAKALGTIPGFGAKAAQSVLNFHKSMNGIVGVFSKFLGPVTLVLAALGLLYSVFSAGRANAKQFDDQLKTNTKNTRKFGEELTKAFYADRGKIGTTVMDQVSISMEQMLRDLEDTASKAPGMVDHLADMLTEGASLGKREGFWGESKEINRRQAEGDAAGLAAKKYKELTDKNIDLISVMTGSQRIFDNQIASLESSGKSGNALADVLIRQREEFNNVYAAMQSIGPKGIELARGLDEIARAGGDATSKLNGLRGVLTGLGFLKVDELEAAAQYTTTLGDLAEQITQLKNDGADFSQIWNADGTLNDTNESAAKLIPVLSQVSNAYLQAATSGKNVDELNQRLNSTLAEIAPSLNTTAEQLKQFFKTSMGAAPIAVQLALQLDGVQDQLSKDITNLLLQTIGNETFQTPIKLNFDTELEAQGFEQQVEDLIGDKFDIEGNGRNVTLKAGVTLDQESLNALQSYVQTRAGMNTPAAIVDPSKLTPTALLGPPSPVAPVPVNPSAVPPWMPRAELPVFSPPPSIAPPDMPDSTALPKPAPVPPTMGQFPTAPPPPAAPASLPNISGPIDEASGKVDELGGKMQNLFSNKDNRIEVNTDKLQEASTQIEAISKTFAEKKLKADVEVNGVEKLQEVSTKSQEISTSIGGMFTKLKEQIDTSVEESKAKIVELTDFIVSTFNTAADAAQTAGSKFVDAFALGMALNPAAVNAANTMAAEIRARFHQSPPKKGPLAAHGDAALYGGKAFVSSYAKGLTQNAGLAGNAANTVAGAASSGMTSGAGATSSGQPGDMPGTGAGEFFGQLLELTNFASSLVNVFSKVTETVANLAKFISDPMGKGTFFGGSLGFKKLSPAELKKRRDEKDQQNLRSMNDSATRDTTVFDNKLTTITNAENAVVDQRGYESSQTVKTVGAMLKEAFPEIANMGGARADRLPFHREGNALDISIPAYNTPEGKALGDRINSWALANAKQLGLVDTIWQDFWQPADGSQGNFMGNKGDNEGHFNHIHLTFAPGAAVDLNGIDMTPEESAKATAKSAQDAAKTALQALQEQYGPPPLDGPTVELQQMRLNPTTGKFEPFTPADQGVAPEGVLDPETKKPWTKEGVEKYIAENPQVVTLPDGMSPDRFQELLNNTDFSNTSQQEALDNAAMANPDIAKALEIAKDPMAFEDRGSEVIAALTSLDTEIIRQNNLDTPGSKLIAQDLESVKSSIMDIGGFAQNANPIDTVAGIAANAAGVASDIIGTIVTGIEAVGAADTIAKVGVRGVANTDDVNTVIDSVQKFIELGAKVSGSVASVASLIGSVAGAAGGADPSMGASGAAAAIQSVATIASLVQAGFETANAVIDLTQEAFKVAGSYFGDFLGYLVGAGGGQLTGDIKFLLDENTNQLLSYSLNNPMDKRALDMPFTANDTSSRNQLVGNINMYGGPGTDPRDMTRQMMFQVNTAQYAGALAQ